MHLNTFAELERTIARDYGSIAGIIALKDGVTRYESYFHGFAPGDAVHVASVTKSVVSILMGIAIAKGHIRGVDQRVLDFFPDYAVPPGETPIREVTITHLLTMTAPFKFVDEPYEAFFASENWVRTALDWLGGEKPAGVFRYSPIIGAHILSGILARATGQSVLDFATENLFAPLGISVEEVAFRGAEEQIAWHQKERHSRGWVADPQGIHAASWGLCLTAMDMARIGQLCLNGGTDQGRRIVPAAWIQESTEAHAHWGELAYGYLWWVLDDAAGIYAALGDGGNAIYVNARKNLVVAIASIFMPEARDRIELIQAHIEPLFAGDL